MPGYYGLGESCGRCGAQEEFCRAPSAQHWCIGFSSAKSVCEYLIPDMALKEKLRLPSECCDSGGYIDEDNEFDGMPLLSTPVFINMYLHAEELYQAGQNTIISFSSPFWIVVV